MTTYPPPPATPEAREAALSTAVMRHVAAGWRVESRGPDQAVLVRGKADINHTFHLLMTLVTCGLWGIVWLIVSATTKEHRMSVIVDPHCIIQTNRLT